MIIRNLQPASTLKGPRLATLKNTPPVPLPPSSQATKPQDFQTNLAFTELRHIDDPTGEERRLFGGWASLEGVAPDGKEVLNEAFAEGAQEYLDRNPIILWNHKNYLPIGRVLSITLSNQGVWIEGEIFRATDLLKLWESVPEPDLQKFPEAESIAAKCEEAWWLISTRAVRGLSVRGRSYGHVREAYSEELGAHIVQVLRLDLIEISVAPIQCHPGTRIEAINTLARSLRTTREDMVQRALFFHETRSEKMDPKEKELLELQARTRALMIEVADENGGTVPESFASKHAEVSRMLSQPEETPPPVTPLPNVNEPPAPTPQPAGNNFNPEELLARFDNKVAEVQRGYEEQIEVLHQEINELKGIPAPRKNRTRLAPGPQAAPKPTELPEGGRNQLQRTLDFLGENDPTGDVIVRPETQHTTIAKMLLIKANKSIGMRVIDGISYSPQEQVFLQKARAQMSA